MVGVVEKTIGGYDGFHLVEGFGVEVGPGEFLGAGEGSEWCKDVGATRPHVSEIITQAEEGAELLEVLWFRHINDGLYLFVPRANACWSQEMTEEVGLLDGPLAFIGVARVAVLVETGKDEAEGG